MNTKAMSLGLGIIVLFSSNFATSETLRIYNFASCETTTDNNSTHVCPSINSQFSGIKSSWVGVVDNRSTQELCARINAASFFGTSVSIKSGTEICTGVANKSPRTIFLNTGHLNNVAQDATYYHTVTAKPTSRAREGGISLNGLELGVTTYFVSEN